MKKCPVCDSELINHDYNHGGLPMDYSCTNCDFTESYQGMGDTLMGFEGQSYMLFMYDYTYKEEWVRFELNLKEARKRRGLT